ncbi:MAG: HRDC domain-containing protein, partial [Planctomycetaceae bacterium]|nr:HRDC domain-containing protein [Planctomycetaceae bacterium]
RSLVRHFGQDLEHACSGNCDVCQGTYTSVEEPLVTAQKILSCIYRQGQRFGATYTAQVLKGSRDQKILANGHEKLSTHGLLQNESKSQLVDWIGQLLQQGYLTKVGEYGVLQLTENGGRLLKGELAPRLLRTQTQSTGSDTPTRERSVDPKSWDGVDRELFESLRELRLVMARERGVPPYVIFGDAALRDMARRRPTTPEGFLLVNGVGKKKAADFGDAFLSAITTWCATHGQSTDIQPNRDDTPPPPPRPVAKAARPAFGLFAQGLSVDDVAHQLGRARSTTMGYLCDYIRENAIDDPSPWIDTATADRIRAEIDRQGFGPLKPLYLALDEQVDYDTIRIVSLCYANSTREESDA